MNKESNIIRHALKDGLKIDPRLLRTGEQVTELFPFVPTDDECSPRPSVKGYGKNGCLEVTAKVKPLEECLIVDLILKGNVSIIDDHDLQLKELPVEEDATLSLSSDPEMADILPSSDGTFDLRPTLLALFYDAVPAVYSTVPLTKIAGDGYTVYSEDEFKKEMDGSTVGNNPFLKLKD